jgi:undecaprenyl-diphosphatase
MEALAESVLDFVAVHPVWVLLVMFVVSFGESFAIVSLVFPGTALLLAAGAMVPSGKLSIWPIMVGAVSGAVIGDGFSYWIGRHFGRDIETMWPFRRRPDLIARGVAFFTRHGGKSVFIGRFFGPVRAIVPLAAGILRMPTGRFWFANIASAVVWAPAILFPGALLGDTIGRFAGRERLILTMTLVVVFLGAAGLWGVLSRARR